MTDLITLEEEKTPTQQSKFLRETVGLVRQIESRFIELGARLYAIREKKMWQHGHDSFEDFLETIHVTPGNASMLAKIYEKYILEGGLKPEDLSDAGYSNLYAAIPLLEDNDINTVVAKAKLLTRQEIKESVREEKNGDCEHQLITICGKCGKRIHETQTDQS